MQEVGAVTWGHMRFYGDGVFWFIYRHTRINGMQGYVRPYRLIGYMDTRGDSFQTIVASVALWQLHSESPLRG